MNLFDCIPASFFNLLSSQSNGQIYSGALLTIYSEYEHEISYRIPRERIRDAVAGYLLDNHIEIDEPELAAAGSVSAKGTAPAGRGGGSPVSPVSGSARASESAAIPSAGDMASAILRRFSSPEVGWLTDEIDDVTYGHNIVMTEQGIRLAEFLEGLMKPETAEFSSYIFDIYNRLNNESQWHDSPYVNALKAVFKNARELSHALKQLSTFIRDIIARMTKEETLESLTNNILDYLGGDFIKEYARLNRQQNIHIYRSKIIDKLRKMESSPSIHDRLVSDCAREENLSRQDADNRVGELFHLTRQFLRDDYDRIMKEIQHKITVYLQLAVGRARFLQNRDPNTRGYVEQALKFLIDGTEQMGMKDAVPPDLQNLFAFETYDFINLSSLRFPGRARVIRTSEEADYERMTDEELAEAMERQRQAAYDPYSSEKMKAYLDTQMRGAPSITTDDLPMDTPEEVLAALSAVAYGHQNGFDVELLDGYRETNHLRLRRVLVKKG